MSFSDVKYQFAESFVDFICQNGTYRGEITLQSCIQSAFPDLQPGSKAFKQQTRELVEKLKFFPSLFKVKSETYGEVVEICIKIGLCEKHCSNKQTCSLSQLCDKLHICKFFLIGYCRFERSGSTGTCNFGHDLHSSHNQRVLNLHGIDFLPDSIIKALMKINRTAIMWPSICWSYNNQQGCQLQNEGRNCQHLHVCREYVFGTCTLGMRCSRCHDIFSQQPKQLLERYCINLQRSPKELLEEMRQVLDANIEETSNNSGVSAGSSIKPKQIQKLKDWREIHEETSTTGVKNESLKGKGKKQKKAGKNIEESSDSDCEDTNDRDNNRRGNPLQKGAKGGKQPDTKMQTKSKLPPKTEKQQSTNENRKKGQGECAPAGRYEPQEEVDDVQVGKNRERNQKRRHKQRKNKKVDQEDEEDDDEDDNVADLLDRNTDRMHEAEVNKSWSIMNKFLEDMDSLVEKVGKSQISSSKGGSQRGTQQGSNRGARGKSGRGHRGSGESNPSTQSTRFKPQDDENESFSGEELEERNIPRKGRGANQQQRGRGSSRGRGKYHNDQSSTQCDGKDDEISIPPNKQGDRGRGSARGNRGRGRGRGGAHRDLYDMAQEDGSTTKIPPLMSVPPENRPQSSSDQPKGQAGGARPKEKLGDQRQTGPAICGHFINGACKYGKTCMKYHASRPYIWQYESKDARAGTSQWKTLDDSSNKHVESEFCKPQVTNCSIKKDDAKSRRIEFETMHLLDCVGHVICKVRRLATKPSNEFQLQKYNTTWCWYWQNDAGSWLKYIQVTGQEGRVSSEDLEAKYQENDNGVISFKTSKAKYTIYFSSMTQKCLSDGTQRNIRRRPLDWNIAQKGEPTAPSRKEPNVEASSQQANSSPAPSAKSGGSEQEVAVPKVKQPKQKKQSQPAKEKDVSPRDDPAADDRPVKPNLIAEVCVHYLRGSCSYGNNCNKYHTIRPYLWQYEIKDVVTGETKWGKNFDDMTNKFVEGEFCKPEVASSKLKKDSSELQQIDFTSMQLLDGEGKSLLCVRRIGTGTSILSRLKKHSTKWCWYWCDNGGTWKEYKQVGGLQQEVTSDFLEEKFQKSPNDVISFQTHGHSYEINLGAMTQKNIRIGTVREIRRRPQDWNLTKDDDNNVTSPSLAGNSSPSGVPEHWDLTQRSDNSVYQLVPLSSGFEYSEVERHFLKTMSAYRMTKLYRIQNLELWDSFERKKVWMKKRGETVNEQHLFHGTNKQYVDAICQQGFDWRISGLSSGTVYGKGSYFARDAYYSRSYTDCQKLFVVRVLVGESALGNRELTRPPPRDQNKPNENFYDSCVDNVSDPKIFVIFKHEQAYPEYMLEYVKRGEPVPVDVPPTVSPAVNVVSNPPITYPHAPAPAGQAPNIYPPLPTGTAASMGYPQSQVTAPNTLPVVSMPTAFPTQPSAYHSMPPAYNPFQPSDYHSMPPANNPSQPSGRGYSSPPSPAVQSTMPRRQSPTDKKCTIS